MKIDRALLDKIAHLSRLEFDEKDAEKMMKDRKYVEETYNRLQTQKIFEWAETQVKPEDKEIPAEEFTKMVEAHQHHHH